MSRRAIVHAARTAVAATVSLLAARLLRFPEAYWAAITTLIVMQSGLGAAVTIARHRFAGTALGAIAGALLNGYFGADALAFGAGVFLLGMVCALPALGRTAYRFASITLAIVMLVAHANAAWDVAIHRFVEVSVGIAVGLLLTAVWPERLGEESDSGAAE